MEGISSIQVELVSPRSRASSASPARSLRPRAWRHRCLRRARRLPARV